MLVNTFRSKEYEGDFDKALNKYFPHQYESDLASILLPYYSKVLTIQQIDTLVKVPSSESVKRAVEGIERCKDAEYRDKLVDETLQSVADKTGKKKKKKNLKKFVSDCTEEYRSVLSTYAQASGIEKLAEDEINAIYHTVSLEDITAYASFLASNAVSSSHQAENAVVEDIYNVQSACISKFQSWTYKAFPSLFTKKQVQPKKRKGRKGKGAKNQPQNNDDVIIERYGDLDFTKSVAELNRAFGQNKILIQQNCKLTQIDIEDNLLRKPVKNRINEKVKEENIDECDDNDSKVVVYLKWSDGEEELHPTSISYWHDYVIKLTLEDGSTITTGYANVIIIEK